MIIVFLRPKLLNPNDFFVLNCVRGMMVVRGIFFFFMVYIR